MTTRFLTRREMLRRLHQLGKDVAAQSYATAGDAESEAELTGYFQALDEVYRIFRARRKRRAPAKKRSKGKG